MKIAVIIVGRLEEAYQSFNLEMLEGCDIFIHTDSSYHTKALEFNPKDITLTDSSYALTTVEGFYEGSVFKLAQQRLQQTIDKDTRYSKANFSRIVQWKRLHEVFKKVNFTEYDFIIKWRDDLLKFEPEYPYAPHRFLNQILKENGNLNNYISSYAFEKENIYCFKDLLFLFHSSKIHAVDVYNRINRYICNQEDETWFNPALLDLCDKGGKYNCARFEWINSADRPFIYGFASETALILNCLVHNVPIKNIFRMLY